MNLQNPVYTEKAECQDCYKCVRHCPVKAIKVENGSATVIPERCIACGRCVEVCPAKAKRVRDDLGRVRALLREPGRRVVASLAPSYAAEFPAVAPAVMITLLQRLGFAAVSETALGAQEVSGYVARELTRPESRLLISSACPSVVALIRKYYPAHRDAVMDICSPLLAHCRLLRQTLGADTRIVFIGPCIAKKQEADANPELLAAAITFADLRAWLAAAELDPATVAPAADAAFVPAAAAEGALYPVDGGMIAGIRANCPLHDAACMAFSGLDSIDAALQGLTPAEVDGPLFLELLACPGGCVNGPHARSQGDTVRKRRHIIARTPYEAARIPRVPAVDLALARQVLPLPLGPAEHAEGDFRTALASVGKYRVEDELNCGGCGYANCREFAAALLDRKAERTMCVTYMRQLAQKKANALINAMPSGVVIVDDTLQIVECNARFARLLGEEAELAYQAKPGLEGVALEKTAPFLGRYIQHVLKTGEEVLHRNVRWQTVTFHFSVFTIEKNRVAGAVLQDVTEPAVQKEQVIRHAQEVIRKNLATVQKIAFLLGENAAETQSSLTGIIDSFSAGSGSAGEGSGFGVQEKKGTKTP